MTLFKKATSQAPKPVISDLDFLPSALAIVETPMSPVRIQLFITLCVLVVMALIWSIIGKIDINADVMGKIETSLEVQRVEPVLNGKIMDIRVKNGDIVHKGQLLVRLDNSENLSKMRDIQMRLYTWQAEILRRIKLDQISKAITLDNSQSLLDPNWLDSHLAGSVVNTILVGTARGDAQLGKITVPQFTDLPPSIQSDSRQIIERDLLDLRANLLQSLSEYLSAQQQQQALTSAIHDQQSLVNTINQRVKIRKHLLDQHVISEDTWLEFSSTLKQAETQLSSSAAQLAKVIADKEVSRHTFDKVLEGAIANNMQKLLDAQRQEISLSEQLKQLQVSLNQSELRSNIDGIIATSVVTNLGQVVSAGQELMRVVPKNSKMQVRAYVSNNDIGFIRVGQHAEIKVNTFTYTRYGTLHGVVKTISRDAITDSQSKKDLADSSRSASSGESAKDSQQLVFPVIIQLDKDYMNINGQDIHLLSGMSVTADIKTDSRRVISYLLSPIRDITSSAFHER